MKIILQVLTTSVFLAISLLASPAISGTVETTESGVVTWRAGVDGVEVEWAPDGNVNRIYSRYSVPVEFADRRGIRKAQTIAEEKAKAGIVRFFNQNISSTRIVAEIQSDINIANQTRETGNEAHVIKTDERTLIETLTEVTTSFAQGSLRGVIILESGYDEVLEEAWVVVGISRRSIDAARQVEGFVSDTGSTASEGGAIGISEQGSEVRSISSDDW